MIIFLALVVFYGVILLPLVTYLSYTNEFSSSHIGILVGILIAGFVTFCILIALTIVLSKTFQALSLRAIFLMVLFAWYNYNCLDYQGKIVGVDSDVFDNSYSVVEHAAFGILALLILLNKRINTILIPAMTIISIAGLASLLGISEQRTERPERITTISPDLFSFSSKMNVLHIVLDGMQTYFVSDLIAKDSAQKTAFDGFYLFPDTLASSDITYLSVASFLSGEAFDGTEPISRYRAWTRMAAPSDTQPDTLPALHQELKNNNFDLDVLTGCSDCVDRRKAYRSFRYEDFSGIPSLKVDLLKIVDFTLLRLLPWSLKPKIYRDGMPRFSSQGQNKEGRSNRAIDFLKGYGLKVSRSNPNKSYKLIHLLTPHGPWTTGPNCEPKMADASQDAIHLQGRCVANTLPEFLASLRHANVYDNTLIVIQGDHGICIPQGLPYHGNSVPDCIGNTNPLLLIKPLGRRGELEISSQHVALTDLPATILEQLGIANNLPGKSPFAHAPAEDNPRYFFTFKPDRLTAFKHDRFDITKRYTIKGSLFDVTSWHE